MFLATTALTEFWEPTQEILCLGPWCFSADQNLPELLTYRMMDSPWKDGRLYLRASADLETRYDVLLRNLTHWLNDIHRVSFTKRYWRILIGPWLLHNVNVLYDRYTYLKE